MSRYFSPTTAQQAPSALRHLSPSALVHTASNTAQRAMPGTAMTSAVRHSKVRTVLYALLKRFACSQRERLRERRGGGRRGAATGAAVDMRTGATIAHRSLIWTARL